MRLTLDEIKVAASAIRALPATVPPNHDRYGIVGWVSTGGYPIRCAAQAVYEFRHNLPAYYRPAGGCWPLDRSECIIDLTSLVQPMGHSGDFQTYGEIMAALPFLETIISAAEAQPCVPVSPSEACAPSVSSPILEESLMV